MLRVRGGCGQSQSTRRKPQCWGRAVRSLYSNSHQPCSASLCAGCCSGWRCRAHSEALWPRWPCSTSPGCQMLSDGARLTGLAPALASAPWLGRRIWVMFDVPKHDIGSKAWHGPEVQTWGLRWGHLPLGEL